MGKVIEDGGPQLVRTVHDGGTGSGGTAGPRAEVDEEGKQGQRIGAGKGATFAEIRID